MPQQCPKCGRFLSNDFVRAVQERLQAPAGTTGPGTGRRPGRAGQIMSCPRCNTELTGEADATVGRGSVRPPDLPPESVRHEEDVLAGWDEVPPRPGRRRPGARGCPPRRLDSDPAVPRHAARPTLGIPPALAIVACGGVAGAFVGALLTRQRRSLGAAVGTLAGAGAAVAGVNLLDQVGADA